MVKLNMKALAGTVVGGTMAAAMFMGSAALAQDTGCSGPGCGGPIDGTPGDPTVPTPVDPTNPGTVNGGDNIINVGDIRGGDTTIGDISGGSVGDVSGGSVGDVSGGSVTDSGNSAVENAGNNVGTSTTTTTNNIQTGGYSSTYNQVRQPTNLPSLSAPSAFAGITCVEGGGGVAVSGAVGGFGGGAAFQRGVKTGDQCVDTVTGRAQETAICTSGLNSPDDAIRASAAEQCLAGGVGSVRSRVMSGEARTDNGTMGLLFGAQAAPVQPVVVQVPAENVTYEDAGRVAPRRVERVQPPAPNMDGNQ